MEAETGPAALSLCAKLLLDHAACQRACSSLKFVNGGISTLPDRFELLFVKTGERPVIQVVWRSVDEMGVKFKTGGS